MKYERGEDRLKTLIWFGFNFTCGITITIVFAIPGWLNDSTAGVQGLNLGFHIVWILLLEGLIGLVVSMAFAKLHPKAPNLDGGAYTYAQTFVKKTDYHCWLRVACTGCSPLPWSPKLWVC